MIKVTSTLAYASKGVKHYRSDVTIEGSRCEIECEIKALIHAFLDDLQLEGLYLDISTEISKRQIEELEKRIRELRND